MEYIVYKRFRGHGIDGHIPRPGREALRGRARLARAQPRRCPRQDPRIAHRGPVLRQEAHQRHIFRRRLRGRGAPPRLPGGEIPGSTRPQPRRTYRHESECPEGAAADSIPAPEEE